MLEDVVPEAEQLQEATGVFQEEMTQFNAQQESFAQKMIEQKADPGHCKATLALEAATQLAQAIARAATAAIPTQEAPKGTAEPRSHPGKTHSQGPNRSRSHQTEKTAVGNSSRTASPPREHSATLSKSQRSMTHHTGSQRSSGKYTPPGSCKTGGPHKKGPHHFKDGHARDEGDSQTHHSAQ